MRPANLGLNGAPNKPFNGVLIPPHNYSALDHIITVSVIPNYGG